MTERTSTKPSCRLSRSKDGPIKFLGRLRSKINKKVDIFWSEHFEGSPPTDHDNFPVPTPPAPTNVHVPLFPEPTPPPGIWLPTGRHDHEASGSSHTSKQNSEYFDAMDATEYVRQHQIPNFSDLQSRPSFMQPREEDQLAGSFGELLLDTPPSQQEHYQPLTPGNQEFFSGELMQSWWLGDDDASAATAGLGVGSEMDTAPSPAYVLPPVAVAPPASLPKAFYSYYTDFRDILRGEEVFGGSGRRGRGLRVLGRIVCIAIRLKVKRLRKIRLKMTRKRGVSEPPAEPSQNRGQVTGQCAMKKLRAGGSTQPGTSEQKSKYKGISKRNGKWMVEIRVSMTRKDKVWIGTYGSEQEAALAYDAGLYHCTEKNKTLNFPSLVHALGTSQYKQVHALCQGGHKEEARAMVKRLADEHAAAFGFSNIH